MLARIGVGMPLSGMDPKAAAVEYAAIRAMSVEEKLVVAESLRRFAWEVKRAALHARYPELAEPEITERVRAAFLDGTA
jgi:hypothetical protein